MATLLNLANTAEHGISSKDVSNEVFMPKDTLDQPCDVVLVVEDGKKCKAHGQVLSEASPFFEKLLDSDMKETKEGIVRLEMFSESVMRKTLEFIYTGNVQILTEDNARDLIVMADYLFPENLKTLAGGFFLDKLNISNCISTYYFFKRYQCEELVSKIKKFILANFTSLYESDRENVLNMSSKEIQMWISSDEINVTAEEDVFKTIVAWIDHDKSKRKKYFAELFRQVRLVYVSRDFLRSNIRRNDLVKDNEGCLDLVEDAMRLLKSRNYDSLPVNPRKSLEVPVIVSIVAHSPEKGHPIQYYFPRENRWYSLGEMPFSFDLFPNLVGACHGKIYGILTEFPSYQRCRRQMVSFNSYTKKWMLSPFKEGRDLKRIFVANEDEIYALVSEPCEKHGQLVRPECMRQKGIQFYGKDKHVSFITKYKPESNSWEDISSFDHMNSRNKVCIVAKDNFVYFIGGEEARSTGNNLEIHYLTNVERYDFSRNQWDRLADIQIARSSATGAAANGKIVIAGGINSMSLCPEELQCEVFIETTNEWQFIQMCDVHPWSIPKLLSVDDRLYVLARFYRFKNISGIGRYAKEMSNAMTLTKMNGAGKLQYLAT